MSNIEQHAESYADAVKEGGHQEEEHHVVEEYSTSTTPVIDQQQQQQRTSVRDDTFGNSVQEFEQTETSFQPRSSQGFAQPQFSAQPDFGRVYENTKEELQNIVGSGGGFNQQQQNAFGAYAQNDGLSNSEFVQQNGVGAGQNFNQSFQDGSANVSNQSANLNQRRSYGFSQDGPSFQQQQSNIQFTQQNGSGGLDSPMAEFDADKRRMNQSSHLNQSTTSRPRRSRPVSQHVRDLVFWRNVKDSGVIFSFGLVLLLSLSYFSIISIFAYLSMTSLIITTSFVLIRQITLAFQQQSSEHPFKLFLDKEFVISPEYAHQQLDAFLKPLNELLRQLRSLYLADSLGQTLKLIFIMYILTYVGSWFNLLTLLTIVWVAAFTLPKTYVLYKEQIDSVIHVVLEGLRDLKAQISRSASVQLNKIKAKLNRPTASIDAGVAGQIRTRGGATSHETIEAEVKTGGGKVSAKLEKKVR